MDKKILKKFSWRECVATCAEIVTMEHRSLLLEYAECLAVTASMDIAVSKWLPSTLSHAERHDSVSIRYNCGSKLFTPLVLSECYEAYYRLNDRY